jgi:hypothetical protein
MIVSRRRTGSLWIADQRRERWKGGRRDLGGLARARVPALVSALMELLERIR